MLQVIKKEVTDESSAQNNKNSTISKRRLYTFAEKFEIIKQTESTSLQYMHETTDISKKALCKWLKQKDEIAAIVTYNHGLYNTATRKPVWPKLDIALNEWYLSAVANGLQINSTIIRNKAIKLAKDAGNSQFKASRNWYRRWITKHRINKTWRHEHDRKFDLNMIWNASNINKYSGINVPYIHYYPIKKENELEIPSSSLNNATFHDLLHEDYKIDIDEHIITAQNNNSQELDINKNEQNKNIREATINAQKHFFTIYLPEPVNPGIYYKE